MEYIQQVFRLLLMIFVFIAFIRLFRRFAGFVGESLGIGDFFIRLIEKFKKHEKRI